MDPDLGTVLITGGASGLGAAVVAGVNTAGGKPVVLDRRPPDGANQAGGTPVDHQIVDLADTKDAEETVRRAADRAGGLDAVVTCAGIDMPGRITDVPTAEWERVVAVNLLGTAAVVRAAIPYLETSGGRVVTVASTLAHRGVSDATAYCASKFGVVGFSRALCAELKGRVGVTMLTPGGMHTAFFDSRPDAYKPPAGALLSDPAHVADGVLFVLRQPSDAEIKELVIASDVEASWP